MQIFRNDANPVKGTDWQSVRMTTRTKDSTSPSARLTCQKLWPWAIIQAKRLPTAN